MYGKEWLEEREVRAAVERAIAAVGTDFSREQLAEAGRRLARTLTGADEFERAIALQQQMDILARQAPPPNPYVLPTPTRSLSEALFGFRL